MEVTLARRATRKQLRALSACLFAIAAFAPASSAAAGDSASAAQIAGAPQADVADNPDANAYARIWGVSSSEAVRRLDLQARAGELSGWVDEHGPSWSGGVYVRHQPDFGVVVLATSSDTPGLSDATRALSISSITSVAYVDETLADLNADAAALRSELPDSTIVRVDVMSNSVIVETSDASAVDAAVRIVHPKKAPKFVHSSRKIVPVTFIYAGMTMDWQGADECTLGFSMLKSGNRRITTAAHCPNTDITRNGTTLTFISQNYGGSHDEQLMSTGALTPTNRVLDGSRDTQTPNYRLVTGKTTRANQVINATYCRFGFGTVGSYACGTLLSKSEFGGMPSAVATTMYLGAINSDVASPGDSGGPVFTSGSALGMMEACVSFDPECNDPNLHDDLLYVAIDFVESGLGATVLTTP
ncbi:MAG TPA: hypothetical protein VJ850_08480 [Candidatus Limnocylindrales bacterium]|nr:hypothetical protein [Candidatus Limnocylindrales bacterium]